MEIMLAIVVVAAVIFFGALISMGNDRQRKAIDSLREQLVLWAMQDLKIKREHLVQAVQVPDPLDWLNKTALRVCAYDLKLQVLEVAEEPQSLICASGDGDLKVIFSPLSPLDIRRIKSSRQSRLSQFAGQNPLLHLPKSVNIHELSPLNSGHLFDLELGLVWTALTGQSWGTINSLWIYILGN
ncbi:hypothetical protein ANAEL_04908 [Anaerolineales bacterium]|jgi:hypothetical protein|nr:hypothetical protein ANAEL_04908 [Anaerolineales bacterium]